MSTVTFTAVMSAMTPNPFDDIHALPITGCSVLNSPLYYSQDELDEEEYDEYVVGRNIDFPKNVRVPIIENLELVPSQGVIGSAEKWCAEREPKTLEVQAPAAIEWTDVDLNYLVSTLYPDRIPAQDFTFTPLLSDLCNVSTLFPSKPITLSFHLRIPTAPASKEAYSPHLPIGTGRPISKSLIASSAPSIDPTSARRSLAAALLLSSRDRTRYVVERYSLLSSLYFLSKEELGGMKRAMEGMSRVSEKEWGERQLQLRGVRPPLHAHDELGLEGKEEENVFEVRMELFLLEAGWHDLARWMEAVDVAIGFEESERGDWARDFEIAACWLGRALREC